MTDFTFSCTYKTGELGYFPGFSFPVTIISIRESSGPDGWTRRVVHFQADVLPSFFERMSPFDVFELGVPRSAYVTNIIRSPCLTVGEPLKGQRAKKGTVPYKRPDQLMRSPNLRKVY